MAEIKVERKENTPIWPWIIGILILAAVVWFLFQAMQDDSEREYERREREAEAEEVGDASLFMPAQRPASMHISDFSQA